MGQLKYLTTHCLETPKGRFISPDDIDDWHRAPRKNINDTITYMGKNYPTLGAADIHPKYKGKWGRGWSRLGYTGYFQPNGEYILLTPHDEDSEVEAHEMTWGATGYNAISRHIAYAGGLGTKGIEDSLTDGQFIGLQEYYKEFLAQHPYAKIAGHYHFTDKKTCPNFSVQEFCQLINLPTNKFLFDEKENA